MIQVYFVSPPSAYQALERVQILSHAKSILKVVFCHHIEALWVAALNKPCTREGSLLQNNNTDAREIDTTPAFTLLLAFNYFA